MDEEQAQAVIATINDAGGEVATKRDLDALRTANKADLVELRADVERLLIAQERRMYGVMRATAALAVAVARLI